VFSDLHATISKIEDLAALVARGPGTPERLAAGPTDDWSVANNLVRLRDLSESPTWVTLLTSDLHLGLLPEASGTL
jgi:hypothetical protein